MIISPQLLSLLRLLRLSRLVRYAGQWEEVIVSHFLFLRKAIKLVPSRGVDPPPSSQRENLFFAFLDELNHFKNKTERVSFNPFLPFDGFPIPQMENFTMYPFFLDQMWKIQCFKSFQECYYFKTFRSQIEEIIILGETTKGRI